MWARIATFEGTDVEAVRARIQQPPENMPEGIRAVLGLGDAEGGRQMFITVFDTREAMEAAEPLFEKMGDEFSEDVRGRRVSKEYWDVMLGVAQFS